MSDNQDRLIGQLTQAVSTLTDEVKTLREEVSDLKSQMDRGKGILFGIFLVGGGLGAVGGTLIHKVLSFIGS